MFEDSLVESTGRIRTRSRWYAVGSFALQAAVLAALIFFPYVYPDALPQQALTQVLVAHPPPTAPPQIPHAAVAHNERPAPLTGLIAPTMIPRRILADDNAAPTPPGFPVGLEIGNGGVRDALSLIGSAPPPPRVALRPKPSGPVRVSAGVAAGRLLTPIQPIYPAIARTAHIQGTVVIEAVISRQGSIEHARIVSGPAMLAQAALAAVNRARYQPFKLNGEPVDVETTINIVFALGQ